MNAFAIFTIILVTAASLFTIWLSWNRGAESFSQFIDSIRKLPSRDFHTLDAEE